MDSTTTVMIAAAKLFVAGLTICAIALAALVFQGDGTVMESEADILDTHLIKRSNPASFARGLEHLGHDEPQSFDINGNLVNFSVKYSRKRPRQLLKEYQEEFVYQGLNSKVWEPDGPWLGRSDMIREAVTGGIVPIESSDGHAVLGGVLPRNDATNARQLEALSPLKTHSSERLFKGYHAIRMNWDDQKLRSTVTATWSDDDFDYAKMSPDAQPSESPSKRGLDVSTVVPACPGCQRINHVRSLDPRNAYNANIFSGNRSTRELTNFYRTSMLKRGWKETKASIVSNKLNPQLLGFAADKTSQMQFSRGADFVTILGYPGSDGETVMHTTVSQ